MMIIGINRASMESLKHSKKAFTSKGSSDLGKFFLFATIATYTLMPKATTAPGIMQAAKRVPIESPVTDP
jgi:hypothetical protein